MNQGELSVQDKILKRKENPKVLKTREVEEVRSLVESALGGVESGGRPKTVFTRKPGSSSLVEESKPVINALMMSPNLNMGDINVK